MKGKLLIFFLLAACACWPHNLSARPKRAKYIINEDRNILVVPFSNQMYFINGHHAVCRYEGVTPGELAKKLRCRVAGNVANTLLSDYSVHLLDAADKDAIYLDSIYAVTEIGGDYSAVKTYLKGYPPIAIWKYLGPKSLRWGTDCVGDGGEGPNIKFRKTDEAIITNDSAFARACAGTNASFVLFLTKFEMNTRFKYCGDMNSSVYQRDIFIHYTLLNDKGKKIDSGIVGTTFNESSNSLDTILGESLPALSEAVAFYVKRKIYNPK